MKPGAKAKLEGLVERLVAAECAGLNPAGVKYLKDSLRWRVGLREGEPSLSGRVGPGLDYARGLIDGRVRLALERPGVAEEVEAAGGGIRT